MYNLEKEGLPHSQETGELCVVYLSTFPPRKCGIATFTEDITNAMDDMLAPLIKSKIVAMNPDDVVSYHYPRKVISQIIQGNKEEYVQVAQRINQMDEVQLVNIQHEFGIFGGEWGSHLISFVETLKKPVVISFHTALPNPNKKTAQVVRSLSESVKSVTVMTNNSKKILSQEYGIAARKIKVIPHGIHPQPYTSSEQAKMTLGYSDRVVLSTFGLLHKKKGLEYVIDALPEVIKVFPNFVYIIFGATHPVVLLNEGESYRNFIIERIWNLGLYDHVKMYNKYFPLGELLHFLKATDIYISPGLDPNQAVSGTLSYALGTGRSVISTAFSQAKELVTDDVGILVDFRNPQAYTEAILQLLEDENRRLQLGENAYFRTRYMVWPNVAVQYARVFSEHAPSLAVISKQKCLPKIKLNHLFRLTDNFGIVRFAKLTRRDASSGYTLDDNAQALAAA
ncbi:MAG: glycosyltransferase family 4 protein, partial [Dehalococcoidia bacterium]